MSNLNRVAHASRRRGATNTLMVAIAVVILLLLGAFFAGMMMTRADQRSDIKEHSELLASMTGLGRPTKNVLAAEFIDADKNLVADAPTDATKRNDPAELVFTFVASEENTAKLEPIFKSLTDAVAAATGKPVRYLPITDVESELHALYEGQLQVCAFNTGAVPNAVDAAGFVPVALLGGTSGPSTYQLQIIASTKSGISSIEGLRGKELALTDMNSNSGYKAPLVLLQQKFKMRPGFDFGIRYSLGYASSIEGLTNGTFGAIAVASDVLARAEAAGTIKPSDYKVLYASDPFPKACFGYAHNLAPALAEKIQKALVGVTLKSDESMKFFGTNGPTSFVPVDYSKDFALIRDIDDTIGYEHKLRAIIPVPDSSTTMPTTVPAMMP